MLRRIALSLSMLAALVVILPLATSTAHNLRFQFAARSHHVRHSRAWWRRHRAMLRRRQALLARRRELLAQRRGGVTPSAIAKADNHAGLPTAMALPEGVYREGAYAMPLPEGWSPGSTNNGASSFRITSPSGVPGPTCVNSAFCSLVSISAPWYTVVILRRESAEGSLE